MGSPSSYLWFLSCLACSLSLSLLPSGVIYATLFFILLTVLSWIVKAVSPEMGNVCEDKAVDDRRKLKKSFAPWSRDVVIVSDLWAKIYSLRQGKQTVEKYFEEFNVVWEKLETIRPLPACTCGAKCSCCGHLRRERNERKKLKVVRFLEGLNGDRFDATRSRIMSEGRLPSLNKVYKSVVNEAAQMEEVNEVQKLNRSIHPHPLTLKPSGAPYICSGCRELGLGPSYCCETDNCNYILHEDCANVDANNSLVFHRFFKESNFMFYKKKPDRRERFCNACGNDVLGFFYHCHTTGKDLHPCCLNLKDSVSDKGGHVTLNLCKTVPKKCEKCKGKIVENNIKGWSYISSDEKYCFHVSCVKGLILDKWKEGYFSKDNMSLQKYDPKTQIPLTCKEMVKAGRSSKGSGKTKVFIKIATVALKLIVSVIFGDPSSFIVSALGVISAN